MESQTSQIVLAMVGIVSVSIAAMRFLMAKVLDTYALALAGIVESQKLMNVRTLEEFSENRIVLQGVATSLVVQTELLRQMRDERVVEKAVALAAAAAVAQTALNAAAAVAATAVSTAKLLKQDA